MRVTWGNCSCVYCVVLLHMCRKQDGHTALHLAAQFGHLDIVKLLVERYPDLVITTTVGCLMCAWFGGRKVFNGMPPCD